MKICSVINWDDDKINDVFVKKHDETDFNYLTQLVVHESQEAIFFMNGQALDLFGPGRYTLETQNIPLVTKFLNRLTGDKNPFHCEVYYVNKTEQMAIKWGTDSRIQYIDSKYGFPLDIGLSGEMSVAVEDSRKLIVKLVGTDHEFNREKMTAYLRGIINSKIKPYVSSYMKEKAISIFEIDQVLDVFSEELKKKLEVDFEDYGLSLNRFMVSNISKPEDDPRFRDFQNLFYRQYSDVAKAKLSQELEIISAQTAAQKTVIESQALATKRAQEGYTYQQERGFDVAQGIAENEAVGQFTNLGVGLGTAAGVGGAIGGVVGSAVNNALNTGMAAGETVCPTCGAKITANAKFCANCGTKIGSNTVICPSCGKETPAGKFCQECGKKLSEE